jgi:hypothetical protein
MVQLKEQNKSPETEHKGVEVCELPDIQIKKKNLEDAI